MANINTNNNLNNPVVIAGFARTPIGAFLGNFNKTPAYQLGSYAIKAAVERSQIKDINKIDEIIMGCVLTAGQGQAPARQAALLAGIPNSTNCSTINKMCGSGMKAIMIAHDAIKSGNNKIMVAGGMENMSLAPYILAKARSGYRMGHSQIQDHMFLDGLEDAYDKGKAMGVFAEDTAQKFKFSREIQDEFTLTSLSRAKNAIKSNDFSEEITAVDSIDTDEVPGKAKPDKIPLLKPCFKNNGTVTAANSSSISDGAAAVILMTHNAAQEENIKPLAIIHAHSSFAQEPAWFTTAPVDAIKSLLIKLNWSISDVDLFEINEAFAVVTLAAISQLDLDPAKVNIHGGSCALGHPIGASGARILCTLLAALNKHNLTKGIAALCIGGGEATAIAIERVT